MSDYVYHIPPCPYYDIRTMELWLEEMAAKGLFLGKEGIFPGIVAFERGTPKKIRYRLVASDHSYSKGRAFRYAPIPDEKTQTFHREFGWAYIATRRDFHIYACTDPTAPEMDTDPQIQAIAFGRAAKRQMTDLICYSLIIVMNLLMFLWNACQFLLGSSHRLNISYLRISALWVLYLIPAIISYRQLRRRKMLLENGGVLPESPGCRKTALQYRLSLLGKVVLIAAMIFSILSAPPLVYRDEEWIPLSDYTGAIPFATMQELLPDAQFREDLTWNNHILNTSTVLADIFQLDQQLHLTLSDGTETSGSLDVIWRKTMIESAAHDQAMKEYSRGIQADHEPVMLSIEGIDYAFYYNSYSFDYVVLQKRDIFLRVSFHIYEGDPISPQEIADIMAVYLLSQ